MPRYRIDLMQTVYESTTVEVEADDQEAAEDKALDMARSDLVLTWTPYDVFGDVEVTHAEEWPPANDDGPRVVEIPVSYTGGSK